MAGHIHIYVHDAATARTNDPGIKGTMHEFKKGTLHSGSKKGPKVRSRKQAIAIGLSKQRRGDAGIQSRVTGTLASGLGVANKGITHATSGVKRIGSGIRRLSEAAYRNDSGRSRDAAWEYKYMHPGPSGRGEEKGRGVHNSFGEAQTAAKAAHGPKAYAISHRRAEASGTGTQKDDIDLGRISATGDERRRTMGGKDAGTSEGAKKAAQTRKSGSKNPAARSGPPGSAERLLHHAVRGSKAASGPKQHMSYKPKPKGKVKPHVAGSLGHLLRRFT